MRTDIYNMIVSGTQLWLQAKQLHPPSVQIICLPGKAKGSQLEVEGKRAEMALGVTASLSLKQMRIIMNYVFGGVKKNKI